MGFVVAVAELRNFTGAFIGTWHIWADLYWFEKCIHFSKREASAWIIIRVKSLCQDQSGSKTINGLNIIDGKVDGKIPLAEYKKYRVDSVHNIDSDTMTLGKYEPTIRADGTKDFFNSRSRCIYC